MSLHRFFVDPVAIRGDRVTFDRDQSRQIRSVLHVRAGDCVLVLDGSGIEYTVRLDLVADAVTGTVEASRPNRAEPTIHLALYASLLKGTKLEMVLQKGTEIGVASFHPVATARSVPAAPGQSKLRRYEAIVREAAEQSRRGRIPQLHVALPYHDALEEARSRGPVVLFWEGDGGTTLRDLSSPDTTCVGLFVGPEGGFTLDEVREAREAGALVVTLGRRILRAETAATVGAALLLHHLGELG